MTATLATDISNVKAQGAFTLVTQPIGHHTGVIIDARWDSSPVLMLTDLHINMRDWLA